jgi:hypothetical protein
LAGRTVIVVQIAAIAVSPFSIELLAKLGLASAPGHPPSLAGFGITFACSYFRQSLLRPGAAFAYGKLQNLPVLQLARLKG